VVYRDMHGVEISVGDYVKFIFTHANPAKTVVGRISMVYSYQKRDSSKHDTFLLLSFISPVTKTQQDFFEIYPYRVIKLSDLDVTEYVLFHGVITPASL